jgi:hypothetical protein
MTIDGWMHQISDFIDIWPVNRMMLRLRDPDKHIFVSRIQILHKKRGLQIEPIFFLHDQVIIVLEL